MIIKPIIKNNFRGHSESGYYRPKAIATHASKLLETLLLRHIDVFLDTSSNQFEFKTYFSTEMCIYGLNESLNY